jgi:hypothetical protein
MVDELQVIQETVVSYPRLNHGISVEGRRKIRKTSAAITDIFGREIRTEHFPRASRAESMGGKTLNLVETPEIFFLLCRVLGHKLLTNANLCYEGL